MKAKLSERRVPFLETQRAILDLLRTQGPMQRWQIRAALGRKCQGAILRLLNAGNIEQYQDDNRDPNPCSNKRERYQALYCAFVRDLDWPSCHRENRIKRAANLLRAAGWTLEPPGTRATSNLPGVE